MTGSPKKRKITMTDIKHQLSGWGCSIMGSKKQLTEKLRHAQAVQGLLQNDPNYRWSEKDLEELVLLLPMSSRDTWEPSEVVFIFKVLNTRYLSDNALSSENVAHVHAISKAYQTITAPPPNCVKNKTITTDSINDLMMRLLRKNVNKWGDADGALLSTAFKDVAVIDGMNSSPTSMANYYQLLPLLSVFYLRRPDIKAKVDPDVVVFDTTRPGVQAAFVDALAGYKPLVHLATMPGPSNVASPVADSLAGVAPPAAEVGMVYSMPTLDSAHHFIGYMCGAVPGLTAVLVASAPGPPVAYW